MFRNKGIYLAAILTVLFIVLIALNHYSPKPINWNETYERKSKSPYGCYVLNDMLASVFPGQPVEYNNESFYVSPGITHVGNANIIVVTSDFSPDKTDLEALLKSVFRGNTLFVAANSFGKNFKDSLKISVDNLFGSVLYHNRKQIFHLERIRYENDSGYPFRKLSRVVFFSAFDSLQVQKLGTNQLGKTNFIGIKYGSGTIYLHTQPQVFTNYHLLHDNVDYAAGVLSHLPVCEVVYDDYYKPGRIVDQSPVRYILTQPSLQMAYYLMLFTLLMYMVVESRRRQRIIPVVKPLENKSLDYVKTVGSLYFNQKNNPDLARKKIIYFKDFIREHYFIHRVSATGECVLLVSAKSGLPVEEVKQLLEIVSFYETSTKVSDDGLIGLNQKIEQFYKRCL